MLEIAKGFFKDLFTSKHDNNFMACILSNVERCVSITSNVELCQPFTEEEVRVAINDMRPTKALSLDGFSALFFQKIWHIDGKKVSVFCLDVLIMVRV